MSEEYNQGYRDATEKLAKRLLGGKWKDRCECGDNYKCINCDLREDLCEHSD